MSTHINKKDSQKFIRFQPNEMVAFLTASRDSAEIAANPDLQSMYDSILSYILTHELALTIINNVNENDHE